MSGSFESVRWNACVHRLDLDSYSHPKEVFILFYFSLFIFFFFFRKWSPNPIYPHGKNPIYRRLRGGSNPRRCITHFSEPNTLPTELFRPHRSDQPQVTNRRVLFMDLCVMVYVRQYSRLVGLVVKASVSRAEDPRFVSRLSRNLSGVESYQ